MQRAREGAAMTRKGLVLFLMTTSLGWSTTCQAQKTLRGKVFAPEDHSDHNHDDGAPSGPQQFDPLPGATVIWKGSSQGVVTDGFGFFEIDARGATDTLRVSMVG